MTQNVLNPEEQSTIIVCVVDKSGSMGHLRDTAIESYNKFLDEQQAQSGSAVITLVLFDSSVKFVDDCVPLDRATRLTRKNYNPNGMTALFDAIASGIASTEEFVGNNKNNVVFVILTDGQENSSKEVKSKSNLSKLITEKRNSGWTFIYLSSDQDAFSDAQSIGIPSTHTVSYTNTNAGYCTAYNTIASTVSYVRNGNTGDSYIPD